MSNKILPVHGALDTTHCQGVEPLLQVNRALRKLENGQVMYVCVNCQSAVDDLQSWCQLSNHDILHIEICTNNYACYLQKSGPYPTKAVLRILNQRCPTPVIEAAHALHSLESGEVLKMISNCPSAMDDVGSWIDNTMHALLDVRETNDGAYIFYIQKCEDSITRVA